MTNNFKFKFFKTLLGIGFGDYNIRIFYYKINFKIYEWKNIS